MRTGCSELWPVDVVVWENFDLMIVLVCEMPNLSRFLSAYVSTSYVTTGVVVLLDNPQDLWYQEVPT